MDVSSVSLGAGLLQVRKGMDFSCDEAPDNMALCSMAFTSKTYPIWRPHTVTLKGRCLTYSTE